MMAAMPFGLGEEEVHFVKEEKVFLPLSAWADLCR